jgi:putative addiction module component (TIGR02574 family)
MSTDVKELTKELLTLPETEREYIVEALSASLTSPETERAWLEEAERRWQEIATGQVECVPMSEVFREAYASLKHER